jgi:hypothetical protein
LKLSERSSQGRGPRPFGLGDALILIAAVAITTHRLRSLGWFQSFPNYLRMTWQGISQLAGWSPWTQFVAYRHQDLAWLLARESIQQLLLVLLCPVLLGLVVAQPLLRLRRPRPPLDQLIRQSGFVTCLIGNTLAAGLFALIGGWWFTSVALSLGLTRGFILLMLWPILALPPWRAERCWIDRLGRGVGWGWIIAMLSVAALEWMGAD